MSDGPYRSLPMRHACKRLAKRAQQAAFDPEQVAEAVCPSVEQDWAAEVPDEVMRIAREVCDSRQGSLFDDSNKSALDAARRAASGRGMLGVVFVDCVEHSLSEGKSGELALRDAAHSALYERAIRNARTIEEHYLRDGSQQRAHRVHARIMDGIGRAPLQGLADQVVTRGASSKSSPPKRGGLDEGVTLP